jgi:hypothetical protein
MTRMGYDSERAAIICQHQSPGRGHRGHGVIDAHAGAELRRDDGSDGRAAGGLAPVGTLIARRTGAAASGASSLLPLPSSP